MHLAVLVVTLMVVGFGNSLNLDQCSIRCDSSSAPGSGASTLEKKLELALRTSEYIHSKALVHYDVRFDRDLVFSSSTQKISKIYDQGLSQTHITQPSPSLQPTLSQERQNGHRFMYFDGIGNKRLVGDMNLNPTSGQSDLVTVFIVFRIDGYNANTYWVRNGIFGHDNGAFDKFICFMPDGALMVSGTTNNNVQITEFPNKANPGAIGQWNVLSVQWNVGGGAAASSVYCNGKLLTKFQSRTSPGDVRFTLGDLNPRGISPLDGAIGDFVMYRELALSDSMIKQHHAYFVDKWNINADPITY